METLKNAGEFALYTFIIVFAILLTPTLLIIETMVTVGFFTAIAVMTIATAIILFIS